ncbi:MAG: helix-turn-helix domain-containing protein [Burkholderiales bacterium]
MNRPIRVFDGRFGRLILLEVSAPGIPHVHAEPTILLKHDGADTEYLIGDETVPLTRRDIAFLNAQEMHADRRAPDSAPTRLLVLHASGEWLRDSFPAVFGAGGEQAFPHRREEITPRIRQLADTLAVEIVNDQFLSPKRLEFMLQELVLSIIDTYFARRRASSPLWRGSRFEDSRIRRAIALLRARPNKEMNMDEVASQVGLSRSRFYDLFQLCTGRSPRAYLDMLCVETAISRLTAGRVKIADVSAELGFSAQSNFTRFFLHQVGIPPSEYRRVAARPEPAPSPPSVANNEPTGKR